MTSDDQEYLVVPKPTRALQWTHAALLTALVIGSLLVVAVASFLYMRNVEARQSEQIEENQTIVEGIAREQRVTTLLASRTQRSQLESAQQQLRLLLCTLDPSPQHCDRVVRDAEKLDKAIGELQSDIRNHVQTVKDRPVPTPSPSPVSPPPPSPSPSPSPSPAPAPSPHVGNSEQCPPHNKICPPEGEN